MLENSRDWKSLLYLLGLPALIVIQWNLSSFSIPLYAITLILAIGIACINHNHAHLPIWKLDRLNIITDYWIATLQGHPIFLFEVAHINGHHRHNQAEQDVTRIARVGHHNHIIGYLLFPVFVLGPINRLKRDYFARVREDNLIKYLGKLAQYIPIITLWLLLVIIDWQKAIIYIFIPQLISLHFLLASNYLQHAQVEVGSRYNHSRNFVGVMNAVFFNIGYHTAHHEYENLHWSFLPDEHKKISGKINKNLIKKSLIAYYIDDLTFGAIFKFLKKSYI